jgi:hypothetical protein
VRKIPDSKPGETKIVPSAVAANEVHKQLQSARQLREAKKKPVYRYIWRGTSRLKRKHQELYR